MDNRNMAIKNVALTGGCVEDWIHTILTNELKIINGCSDCVTLNYEDSQKHLARYQ